MPDRDDPKSQFKCCINKGLGQEKAEGSLHFLFILSYDLVGVGEGCLSDFNPPWCTVAFQFTDLHYDNIFLNLWAEVQHQTHLRTLKKEKGRGGRNTQRKKNSGWYSLPLSLRLDQQLRKGFQVQRERLCYSCFMA